MKRPKISLLMPGKRDKDRVFTVVIKKELSPMPNHFRTANHILVIGGIEGNFRILRRILVKNSVINSRHEWIFGDGRLVVLGNCLKEDSLECLWLIYSLEEKAEKSGGCVHFILGSNEIEKMNGDWSALHPKYAVKNIKDAGNLCVLFDGNKELLRWLKTKRIFLVMSDFLFTQGSLNPFNINGESQDFADSIIASFGIKNIIVGFLQVPGVTYLNNEKVINVFTSSGPGHAKALSIVSGSLYIVDSNGKRQQLLNSQELLQNS